MYLVHVLGHIQAGMGQLSRWKENTEYCSLNKGFCSLFDAFMTLSHLDSNKRIHDLFYV